MKFNRFLWLTLLAIAGLAGFYVISCQRDTEQSQEKSLSNTPVSERACPGGYCEFFVTVNADADFEFCGDLANATGFCDYGCNPAGDQYIDLHIPANTTGRVCVATPGSVCIQNAASAPTIGIQVQFGSSTPINATIPAGQTHQNPSVFSRY